jgi:hypothetical protein
MSFRFVLLAAAAATLSAASPALADFTVNFAGLTGDSNPLVVPTSDGNSVTFDSPTGPGTFSVANTGLFTGFGAGLGDYASSSGDTLTISFANPIEGGVSFPFGIEDLFNAGDDFLTVTSNTGASVVANGIPDSGPFPFVLPEGSVYIDAPGTTVLTITSGNSTNSNPFAIGNVNVPEPVTLSILGVGFAGLAAAARRRRA